LRRLIFFFSCAQICKYPDKTKRRHEKLSSEEYAGTQVPQDASRDYDEDDSYPAHAGPSRVNSNGNNSNPSNANANPSVWKKNFRDAAFEENQAGNYKRPRTEQNGKMGYYNKKARTSSSASYGAVLGGSDIAPFHFGLADERQCRNLFPLWGISRNRSARHF
jgi:bloom syndrome protein